MNFKKYRLLYFVTIFSCALIMIQLYVSSEKQRNLIHNEEKKVRQSHKRRVVPEKVIKLAKLGDSAAQFILANYYFLEDSTVEQALKYYRKSSDKGYKLASRELGISYFSGVRVKRNIETGTFYFLRGAKQGDWFSQIQVGMMQEEEEFDSQLLLRPVKSIELYRMAANQDKPFAQFFLANIYSRSSSIYYGKSIVKNDREAFIWCRKAAKQGLSSAQNELGEIYESGRGVDTNIKKAFYWYRMAAIEKDTDIISEGSQKAWYNIGRFYENGYIVPRNIAEAKKWYKKVIEKKFNSSEVYKKALSSLKHLKNENP